MKNLLKQINSRRFSLVLLLVSMGVQARAEAWGYSWISVFDGYVSAGVTTQSSYWGSYGGSAAGATGVVTVNGAYLMQDSVSDYSGFAHLFMSGQTQGSGYYQVVGGHYEGVFIPEIWTYNWVHSTTSAAGQYWQDPASNWEQTATWILNDLMADGSIIGWETTDFETFTLHLGSTSPARTAPVVVAACIFQPELCLAGAAVISIIVGSGTLSESAESIKRTRGHSDPETVRTLGYEREGTRDGNGTCDPSMRPPQYKWQAQNYQELGVHWHWVKWNLRVTDCRWFLSRHEGPSNPGEDYILIPGIF